MVGVKRGKELLNGGGVLGLVMFVVACGTPERTAESIAPAHPAEPAAADSAPIAPQPTELQHFLAEQRIARNARRTELERRAAIAPGWELFESEHYFLTTAIDDPPIVEEALARLEAVRARLVAEFPPDVPGEGTIPFSPILVRIFDRRSAYCEYGGPAGSSSYYWDVTQEMVLYDDRLGAGIGSTWSSLQHIAVHAYFGEVLEFELNPQWLLYGTAAVYAGMVFKGGELRIDHFDGKFEELRRATAEGPPLPLEALLAFDRNEFYGGNEYDSPARRNLILAWSFIYFLRAGHETRPGWREEWRQVPRRFVEGWQENGSLETARKRALEGIDLGALESAWHGWIEEVTKIT